MSACLGMVLEEPLTCSMTQVLYCGVYLVFTLTYYKAQVLYCGVYLVFKLAYSMTQVHYWWGLFSINNRYY